MIRRSKDDLWEDIRKDLEALEKEESEHTEQVERIPCPDPSCVGSLGEDGCCRVCGLSGAGDEGPDVAETMVEEQEPPGEHPKGLLDEDSLEEIESRVLCSDESCVGTVGDDGYCRVCGLKWKEEGYQEGEKLIYR